MPKLGNTLDANDNKIINALLDPRTSDPAVLKTGKIWYRSDLDQICIYDGTTVQRFSPGGGGGTSTDYVFSSGSWGTQVNIIANQWKTLPIPSGFADITPAGAFIVNGDGSLTVRDAGHYDIEVVVQVQGNTSGWESASIGPAPDAQGFGIEMSQAGGTGANYPHLSGSKTVKLATGEKLYVTATTGAASTGFVKSLSVTRIGAGPTGPVAAVPQEGWHVVGAVGEPAFANGWGAGVPAPRFRKDPAGVVYIEGLLDRGSGNQVVPAATPAFTLPPGYAPTQQRRHVIWTWSGAAPNMGIVRVNTDGTVVVESTGASVQQASIELEFSIAPATFPAGSASQAVIGCALRAAHGTNPVAGPYGWTPINVSGDVVLDTSNGRSPGGDTSKWTVPVTGWYDISVMAVWAANASGQRGCRVNRSSDGQAVAISEVNATANGTAQTPHGMSAHAFLTAGETLQYSAYQNAAAIVSHVGRNAFSQGSGFDAILRGF